MSSTKVFVLGANGYIGGGVALAFRRAGYKVYGGIRNEKNAANLLRNEIIPVIGDQSNPASFEKAIKESSIIVDGVGMNEHSQAFVDYVKKLRANHPVPAYRPLFIFTSGIMTYHGTEGSDGSRVFDESIEPTPTNADMVLRKRFEDSILTISEFRAVIIRPGFVFGGTGGPIGELFFNIKPDEDLVLVGSKDKRWSWVHVDDLGEAFVKVAKAGSVVDGQVFNVVSHSDFPTYEELRLTMAKAAGWKGKVKEVPISNEISDWIKVWESTVLINPQKAVDLLGWQPSHGPFLKEIDTYYQSYLQSKSK